MSTSIPDQDARPRPRSGSSVASIESNQATGRLRFDDSAPDTNHGGMRPIASTELGQDALHLSFD
jgi:hypothetical protein